LRNIQKCSCINGSKFDCSTPYDNAKHGHFFVPPGGYCDFDVFAGELWSQRIKRYLLNNGIAVLEANAFQFDGWEAWRQEYEGSYDPPFFAELARATRAREGGAAAGLGALDPNQAALRGYMYSSSAQMVSRRINLHARSLLSCHKSL
jgi:hypothetical protein